MKCSSGPCAKPPVFSLDKLSDAALEFREFRVTADQFGLERLELIQRGGRPDPLWGRCDDLIEFFHVFLCLGAATIVVGGGGPEPSSQCRCRGRSRRASISSYMQMAPATAALRLSISPTIGIVTVRSADATSSRGSPCASFPTSRQMGRSSGSRPAISVINRLVDPGSEHRLLDWYRRTGLPELMGNKLRGWKSLFNGKNLDGWKVKITGYELGENFGDTFRVAGGVIDSSHDAGVANLLLAAPGDAGHAQVVVAELLLDELLRLVAVLATEMGGIPDLCPLEESQATVNPVRDGGLQQVLFEQP